MDILTKTFPLLTNFDQLRILVQAFIYQLTITKVVGYVLVFLSLFVKIPQIKKILAHKSVVGISHQAVTLECMAQSITITYNIKNSLSFSLFGEIVFVYIQNMVIFMLFFVYSSKNQYRTLFFYASIKVIVLFLIIVDSVPEYIKSNLIYVSLILYLIARVSQLSEIIKLKKIGSLSPANYAINAIRNSTRLITLIVSSNDIILYVIQAQHLVTNLMILTACYYYKEKPKKQ